MNKFLSEYFFYYFTISSFIRFMLVLLFSGQEPVLSGERRVRLLVAGGIILDAINLILIVIFHNHLSQITIDDFFFFSNHFKIIWTTYSVAFFIFCIALIALVARFASYYLHRDPYFYKFFSLLYVLEFAVSLIILTSTSESIFIGWELLGLSSVLLIAFYEHRMSVLKNSLVILVVYKLSDVLLYSALIASAYFGNHVYTQIDNPIAVFIILCACLIKSSVFPWIWLPRAMEGPTPSSALFYGGIATHIPMFLFLNISINHPATDPTLTCFAAGFLLAGTVCSSLMSKRATDAKSSIAYASCTQLGIIYMEILLQFYTLALIHGIVNGTYRTIEFLKSPSQLQQRHLIEKTRSKTGTSAIFTTWLPLSVKNRLYTSAFHEFYLPRLFIHSIELFLGLPNSRTKKTSIRNYLLISLSVFFTLECVIYFLLQIDIDVADESLLLLGLIFNFVATLYKYRPLHFFTLILTSTLAVFTILFEHLHQTPLHIEWLYVLFLLYFLFDILAQRFPAAHPVNYTGRIYKSVKLNVLILIAGISLIGIPGFTSYIIWERLEHELLPYYPNLIVAGFFILTLNTILFFRFYFANFLGKRIQSTSYELVHRI